MYVHTYTRTHTCVGPYTRTHTRVGPYTKIYAHTYTRTHTHVCVAACREFVPCRALTQVLDRVAGLGFKV